MNEYESNIKNIACEHNGTRPHYPQWIVTDTRFENELKAIQDKGGICVKVERSYGIFMNKSRAEKINKEGFEHPSETSLDHVKEWDWIFHNNGSIENLVEQVKEFLTHFKII